MNPALNEIITTIEQGYQHFDAQFQARHALGTMLSTHPFAIAPAARIADRAIPILKQLGYEPRALCDKDSSKWGTTIHGVPVMSYEQWCAEYPEGAVLVASALHDSAICESLSRMPIKHIIPFPVLCHLLPTAFATREYLGLAQSLFKPEVIPKLRQVDAILADEMSRTVFLNKLKYYLTLDKKLIDTMRSTDPIYFEESLLKILPQEIFADAGAYRGDTLTAFLNICGGEFNRYYAFEPDPMVLQDLHKIAQQDPARIECVTAGVSDTTTTMRFVVSGGADSRILQPGEVVAGQIESLDVIDLDTFFQQKAPPTFIKMDIEGFEREALTGAQGIITGNRPKLAVSSYHYPRDLWEIPLLMAQLQPHSKIYLRHYTREIDDTVCYSIPSA
jgi:FkbM family methyltransferase